MPQHDPISLVELTLDCRKKTTPVSLVMTICRAYCD